MSKILYLVHRIPYPPDKGDKIRSYHLLRFLAAEHELFLCAFVDDPAEERFSTELRQYCADIFLCPVGSWRSRVAALTAGLSGRSLSVGYYADPAMNDRVRGLLTQHRFEAIVAFSSTMAQYLPPRGGSSTIIADFVDVDSDKWRQYGSERRWPFSWIYRYESRALASWEAKVLSKVDAVSVVSAPESEIVPGLNAATRSKIHVIPNGVDYTYFDPSGSFVDPYAGNRKVVVFTGAMDYYANEDGIAWFVEHAWSDIQSQHGDAEFYIVGRNPSARIRGLTAHNGVTVTGRVPDVRPYLHYAALAVAPLRLARGVQNKVLEALAMNIPVVATSQALRALRRHLPTSATEATSAADFAAAVSLVLSREKIAVREAGREYILSHYDWHDNLKQLGQLISRGPLKEQSVGR